MEAFKIETTTSAPRASHLAEQALDLPTPYSHRHPDILLPFLNERAHPLPEIDPFERQLVFGLIALTSVEDVARGIAKFTAEELRLLASKIETGLKAFKTHSASELSLLDLTEYSTSTSSEEDTDKVASHPIAPSPCLPMNILHELGIPIAPSDSQCRMQTIPSSSLLVASQESTGPSSPRGQGTTAAEESMFRKLSVAQPLPDRRWKMAKVQKKKQRVKEEERTETTEQASNNRKRINRDAAFRRAVLKRHDHRCCLTGISNETVETRASHIFPHAVCGLRDSIAITSFWQLIVLLFGSAVRDEIYKLVSDEPDNPVNGILLKTELHQHFDRGYIYLLPNQPATSKPADSKNNKYILELVVNLRAGSESIIFTKINKEIEKQIWAVNGSITYNLSSGIRPLEDGDIIRLFTNDPTNFPLTSDLLLSCHGRIWQLISMTGLMSTNIRIDKRIDDFIRQEQRHQNRHQNTSRKKLKCGAPLGTYAWPKNDKGDDHQRNNDKKPLASGKNNPMHGDKRATNTEYEEEDEEEDEEEEEAVELASALVRYKTLLPYSRLHSKWLREGKVVLDVNNDEI